MFKQFLFPLGSAEVEVVKKSYTKLSDAYGCLGVLLVNSSKYYDSTIEQILNQCINILLPVLGDGPIQYLVMVTGIVSVGKIGESEVFRINQTNFISLKGPQTVEEERVTELRKYDIKSFNI